MVWMRRVVQGFTIHLLASLSSVFLDTGVPIIFETEDEWIGLRLIKRKLL